MLQLNQGTLYPALLRLEQRGWISSKWGTSENNRRARFYTLTRAGRKQLQREADDWQRMAAIMTRVLGGAPPEDRHDVRELLARAGGVLGFGRRDRDLAQELAFHREMLEERHRARGLDPAAARRAARLELGGDAQIAETWRDQRSLPFLDTLRQDVRYGVRMLRRTPGFTAAALLTLTLGIGANTAIFTVVDAVLLRPAAVRRSGPARHGRRSQRRTGSRRMSVSRPCSTGASGAARFESFAMMRSWLPTLVANGEAERLPAVRVSWNYFDMLGVRPALGRGFTADDDRPDHWRVLLLSDRLWRRRFGADPSVVGRTVVMNDRRVPRHRRDAGVVRAARRGAVLQRGRGTLGADRLRPDRRFVVPELPAPARLRRG